MGKLGIAILGVALPFLSATVTCTGMEAAANDLIPCH